jgi:hypothetical protein
MNDPIVPIKDLAAAERSLPTKVRKALEARSEDTAHPKYGAALRRHLLFADKAALTAAGLGGLSPDVAFYNAYYWFLVFAQLSQAVRGFDAGVEQQAGELLANHGAGATLDFELIEALEARAKSAK